MAGSERSGRLTRREALRLMGVAGTVLVTRPSVAADQASSPVAREIADAAVRARHGAGPRGIRLPAKDRSREGRFGAMFKGLPVYEPPDALLVGLAASMEQPRDAPPWVTDNPKSPAGFAFLGQFVDHDLTADFTPIPDQQADPDAVRNFRSARFDLDSVYGLGPAGSPEFYDPRDRAKLLVANQDDDARPDDVPRTGDGLPVIGDPRNDVSLIVCQLHVTFMKFHNRVVDHLRRQRVTAERVFEEARRLTRWHFQWIVVHEFLPHVVGRSMLAQLFVERAGGPPEVRLAFYKPRNPHRPMMPIEFSAAAYRFGYSQVRPDYRVNSRVGAAFFGDEPTDRNLNGFRPILPGLVVEWGNFFDLPGASPAQRSRRIDTDLSVPLFRLPRSVVPPPDTRVSLAERNLLRGKRLGLPSGQAVARAMGIAPLANRELGLEEPRWENHAPLWYYVLKEAELLHRGEHLGPVGGRVVAEVLLGLLERDKGSYLRAREGFAPRPPISPEAGRFGMGDLLRFAGAL